ncbi:DUF4440 domain-containing protein [uncultured Croceitalea sp.]|uniref:nuclear transport factor 2 family protein n=1 Tax=uncultured Croceitalea sp. TaxID=1798908 RepID=UPI00374E96C1
MSLKSKNRIGLLLVILGLFSCNLSAQNDNNSQKKALNEIILKLDVEFWDSYNSCDLEVFKTFFTKDLEFYHDKGGLTSTSSKLMEQVANGLCGNKNSTLRREAIEGTVNVYPLNNYGAIITGEHLFYFKENDKKEKLIEKAKFTHVWKLENKQWKMSRVLSYDHQAVSSNMNKSELELSQATLALYVGKYQAPKTGLVKIHLSNEGVLVMNAGQMKAELHPEKENIFFIKEAPITLEFIKDEEGQVTKFMVKENGSLVEEATKTN